MKAKHYIILLAGAMMLAACDDFLTTHPEGGNFKHNSQDDQQIQGTIGAIPERVSAAIAGMYAPLKEPLGYFGSSNRADDCGYIACAIGQDLNSADMTNIVSDYDWFSVAQEWSDRDPSYANPQMRLGLFYKVIYNANEVIRMIPEETSDTILRWNRGQALALRAFSYLSLAPYFQFNYVDHKDALSLPILGAGDANNNPRVSLEDLYQKSILPDLNQAIADLGCSGGFYRNNKGQIDLSVAYGLMARAQLYMENWAAAAAYADSALNYGPEVYTPYTYTEVENNPQFCNATDHPWMWALLLPQELTEASGYTSAATWPSQLSSFSASGYVAFAGIYRSINTLLWNKIGKTDVRRAWWLDEKKYSPYLENMSWDGVKGQGIVELTISNVKQPMNAYANVKFLGKSGCGAEYNDGDWCMMRAEEMLLIKAEATAMAGDEGAGKDILNELMRERNRNYAQTCPKFQDEVWLQRRIELWGEGFAMADVMRLKKNVVRFIDGKESNVPELYRFNIAYGDPWMLLRFVNREITNNRGCTQNTGGLQPQQGDGKGLTDGVTNY